MISTQCKTESVIRLTAMTPFQGDLKKRSSKDIKALAASLKEDGLIMPFALWKHDDKLYILDGHGRREALMWLAMNEDATIMEQEFPYLMIEADTEEEARKSLLQISSSYGKVYKAGLVAFIEPIQGYKAPIIKTPVHKAKAPKASESDKVIIKIQVDKAKADELVKLLKNTSGVWII